VVITGVRGTDTNNDGSVENRIMWQRFDGGYIVAPLVGCNQSTTVATLPNARQLLLDEVLFHVQVSYKYRPIFSDLPFSVAFTARRFQPHHHVPSSQQGLSDADT
jgi:hypothetical protein